jgi:hypothetical protein
VKIIQVPATSRKRANMLLAAIAEIRLRHLKRMNPHKRKLRSVDMLDAAPKYWTDDNYDTARSMQLRGFSNADIARRLGRSLNAVNRAVGTQCAVKGRYAVTDRPDHIKAADHGAARHHRGEASETPPDQRTSAAA